jgi:glycosyltransferase involved in cell wall biosynthesis
MAPADDNVSTPLITVLITTHNYGQFIEQAINSVLSQDFPLEQVEVLVVDDGSTDDTSERVKKYGSRIEYFYKPNGGQASALNFGFAHARGEIVALLDADDLFLPGKLARIAEAFQRDAAIGMVYHHRLEWDVKTNERRTVTPYLFSGDLRSSPEQFISYPVLPASCISFRRRDVNPLLPVPETIRMLGDAYLVILLPLISPVLALSEPLTCYRIHPSNSYYADEQEMSPQARNARGKLVLTLLDAVLKWATDNQGTKKQRHVRFFLNRWVLEFQSNRFNVDPPGRWHAFLFLLRQNYFFSSLQTWRFTAFNYLAALSGLVLEYCKAQAWRDKMLGRTQRWLGKFSRATTTNGEVRRP